ncbi:MAG TPA: tetratricopeptide repeat protein [Polyangium sp.]|nr:tetratricopeptide repeat protein [Polyangium sp.]
MHTTRRFRSLACSSLALALVLGLAPIDAGAQQASSSELLQKARAALASGDTAGACALFEQSRAARTSEGEKADAPKLDEIQFDLADCLEKSGKLEDAAKAFEALSAGTGEPAEKAKVRAAALRAKLAPPPQPLPPPAQAVTPTPPIAPVNPEADKKKDGAGLAKVVTAPPPVRIGDFMDTRLTWVFGDDDVLHATGRALPLSPDTAIGDRKSYRLFFDNLNSRFAGRENLTHLALYKKMPGFIKNLDTEASLLLRLDVAAIARQTNNLNQSIYDAGTYIRAFYHTDGKADGKQGLSVTLWPLDTDRFRLGYLYDISWGGTNPFINQSIFPRIQGSAPGGKITYEGKNFSVFFGVKTATIIQLEGKLEDDNTGESNAEEFRVGQTNYGLLAGGSVDPTDFLHVDVGGGYFQQGKFDLPDVEGQRIYTAGLSGRVLLHDKTTPVPQSIDFQLYRNDPNKPTVIFKPESYTPGKTTWSVALEGTNLWQQLKNFDVAGGLALQSATAFALQANVKSSYLRGSATVIYRDLPYVLRNQPSFIPFQTLPADAGSSDEVFFALASDYYLPKPRLTLGLGGGLQLPATFSTATIDSSSAPIKRTVVVREQGNIAILPVNQQAVPIFQLRASLKWDISPILSALLWMQYVRDNNGTFVERDPSEGTLALRTFISPDFLGFGTSVSARF